MKNISAIWIIVLLGLVPACSLGANSAPQPAVTARATVELQPPATESTITPIESQATPTPALDTPVITYNEIKEGQLTTPNQVDEWVFNGKAGERVNIVLNSRFDSYLELYAPNDEFIASNDDSGNNLNAALFDLQLKENGPHKILVRGYNNATGGYVLALTGGHPTIGGGPLTNGESRTVMLSQHGIKWQYQGQAGTYLTVSVDAEDLVDPSLALYGPDGTRLTEDDDSGGGLNPEIYEFELPTDGAYTVAASTADKTGMVTLNLKSSVQSSGGGPLPIDTTQAGTLKPGRTHRWSFSGQAGQIVTLSMNSADFDTFLELRNSQDIILAESDDSPEGTNALIELFALPANDTYTVVARSPSNQQGGDYNISLKQATVAAGGGSLVADTPAQALLAAGQADTWTFQAEAGSYVTVQVQSDLFDPYLELYGPGSTLLAEDDDSGGGLNAALPDYPIETDGEYQVVVRSARQDRNESGVYEILLTTTQDVDTTGQLTSGDTIEGSLSQGQQHTWTFEAGQGSTVTIRTESTTIDTYLALYDSAGELIAFNDDFQGTTNAVINNFAIPQDGEYRLVTRAYSDQEAGDYTLSIEIGN